jgi:hypothetical protein
MVSKVEAIPVLLAKEFKGWGKENASEPFPGVRMTSNGGFKLGYGGEARKKQERSQVVCRYTVPCPQ